MPTSAAPGGLEERRRAVAVVGDLGVGVVVDDDDVVAPGEIDDPGEEVVLDDAARGVVRVVDEHQPGARGHVGRDRVEVGLEAELGQQRHRHRLRAGQERAGGVDRVAGIARQRDVARVQEGQVDVGDGLLGPHRRDDLGRRIEGHAEAGGVELGHRVAVALAPAVGGVLVGVRAPHLVAHHVHHQAGGGRVRIPDAQGDDVDALGPLGGDLLLDLGEEVRGEPPEPFGSDGPRAQSSSSARARSGDSSPR